MELLLKFKRRGGGSALARTPSAVAGAIALPALEACPRRQSLQLPLAVPRAAARTLPPARALRLKSVRCAA